MPALIKSLQTSSRKQRRCQSPSEEVNPVEEASTAAAAPLAQAAIPEGTVIGDGNSRLNLARLDTRLLHGQVATAWTPDSKADRIIVASDSVAKDELRKELIKQAAPMVWKQTLSQFKN